MGKAHNRNKQKLSARSAINVTGAKGSQKNKPFIGVNVYTKEDDAIIEQMLKDPNWSVPKIKDALPYKHTTKNIMNKLLQFCSQKEIDAHALDKDVTPSTKPIPEKKQPPPQETKGHATSRWTADELNILYKNMNDIPLGDPVWETLIPNRSLKAIYNKAQRLMNEKPKSKEPERINGWLVSDIELLKLAVSEPDDKPLPELLQDIIDSLDEKRTAIEINEMAASLGLTIQEKPAPIQKESNMTNAQVSPEPADERLALLGQLYTLVQQFPEYVTYDIRVNFGGGIHFGANNPDKPK